MGIPIVSIFCVCVMKNAVNLLANHWVVVCFHLNWVDYKGFTAGWYKVWLQDTG